MKRTILALLSAATLLTFIVAAAAQTPKEERRERLRNAAEAAAETAAGVVEQAIQNRGQQGGEVVAGEVIVLDGKPAADAKSVNLGGLVVVNVRDSGSRPPQNIAVDGGRQFQRLGQLRGVAEKDGRPLMGGGYTWILLKPVTAGEGVVPLTFTPNASDGQPVRYDYKVKVTDPNQP